jgi:hypothetical protein
MAYRTALGRRSHIRSAVICLTAFASAVVLPVTAAFPLEPLPPTSLCDKSDPVMSHARPGPHEIGSTSVLILPSDHDGEPIELGVVRPDVPVGQKAPVIVVATPYLNHTLDEATVGKCAPRLVENFVQHGYAIGFIAVRGTSGSGGCSDLTGSAERADLDQAITWFGTQSWSNGRVGMVGVSYDGATAWEVASMGNKYLKTIVPMSGVNDFFDLMYRNGMPEYRSAGLMNALYYAYPFFPGEPTGRSPVQNGKSILCPEVATGLAAATYSAATGERDPLGFWAERNSRPGVEENYRGSIFIARGLQDSNVPPAQDFPWVNRLKSHGTYVKYMLGQWGHEWPDSASDDEVMDPGEPVRWDWANILLDWWDRWLKNDKTVHLGPRAQVQDSSGTWRNEKSWPPTDAKPTDYFLTPQNGLSLEPSLEKSQYTIVFDPAKHLSNSSNRPCVCARFRLPSMGSDLRFAGIPELAVTVVPSGPGGHLSAFLYAGTDLVGWGAIDLRFSQGGETATPVIPGQPLEVRVPFEPLDVVVAAGTPLTLLVAQSGYGGSYSLTYRNSAMAFPLQLQVGGDASRLTLSTFTRDPKAFFVPPTSPRSTG